MSKYKILIGDFAATDNTLILENTAQREKKEYLIESGAWQILAAFGDIGNIPDFAGDVVWDNCDRDLVDH